MSEAITSNRRRIDPYLLFVFIILYKNTRNQTHRSFCVLFILPNTNTIKFYLWYDSLVYKYYNAGRQFHVKRGKLREK